MSTDHDQHYPGAESGHADTTTGGAGVAHAPSRAPSRPAQPAAVETPVEVTREFPAVPSTLVHPTVPAPYGPVGAPEHYGPAGAAPYGPVPPGPWNSAPAMASDAAARSAAAAVATVAARGESKPIPRRGWRRGLYATTRINLGRSPDERYERELAARVRRNVVGSYQIGILGLKGGAGKTAVTVTLGSALAQMRGDRILAVDADPDCGNLGDRAGRRTMASVTELLTDDNLQTYNDMRAYTSSNDANLEVLASADYSRAGRDFSGADWGAVVQTVSRYYNLVLADCGAGLFHSAARGVLSTASSLVIVASASVDGARQGAVAMDWLRQNGHEELASRSCVVINHVARGRPTIDMADLIGQFERYVLPGHVIDLPWDKHIAAGTTIEFELLGESYKRRIAELAAALSDDFAADRGH